MYPIIIGRETLTILPLEGAVVGVGMASVAAVVVTTGASVAPVEIGPVAAVVVVSAGRVATQVFTSVAVVSAVGQHAPKMASQ